MSQRSESPVSDRLDASSLNLSENSSVSDMESDYSKDINLNSKKFVDCNLFEAEPKNENIEDDNEVGATSEMENLNTKFRLGHGENGRTEELRLQVEDKSKSENATYVIEPEKNSVLLMTSSTPKPELTESQAFCNLFSISPDASPVESENGGQTYLVTKTPLNQSSLTNEEIGKKFQDLSFAYKTDSMTIKKRLELMKRKRDQAEYNIENELKIIKGKLKTLLYMGLNSEYVNLMTDLKKELDFVLNATVQLSSSAEGYGYAQHEERLLDLVGVMLQHVENVESSKIEISKASDKLKEEIKRCSASTLNAAGDEDGMLRRRSVAAVAVEGNSRRRASIATLPRIGYTVLENGSNGKGSLWTPNRPTGNSVKKLSFSQTSPRTHISSSPPGNDDLRRDSTSIRHRRESKTSESSMKNIDEEQHVSSVESEFVEDSADSDNSIKVSDSSLNLKQLFGSLEEVGPCSSAQEHVSAVYCLRRLLELNKLLLSSTRFRWPENVFHYLPFYVTWYVVFILAFVFIGGLLTGINGRFIYSCLKYSVLWLLASAFLIFTRRFYRILLPLFLTLALALTLFALWLTKILLPRLTNEEVDSLLRTLGFEIRYLYGPPPV